MATAVGPRRRRARRQVGHGVGLGCWWAVLLVVLASLARVEGLSKEEWRKRSIYQLVTDRFATSNNSQPRCVPSDFVKCGGSLGGIINRLDYIQGMGFDSIWISPIVQNLDSNAAYHGYWPANLLALQEPAANLMALSNALHNRGMALMIDLVVNDVAWSLPSDNAVWDPTVGRSSPDATDGLYGPFNKPEMYHPRCAIDYNNDTSVQYCWIGEPAQTVLPDLNTESSAVRQLLYDHIKNLVSTYQIDGIRIDAAKHVNFDFWSGFQAAAGTFTMGEVLDGDPQRVKKYQPTLDSVLNFPMWYPLRRAFTSTTGSMSELSNMIGTMAQNFDTTVLGQFVSNHDFARVRALTTDSGLLNNIFTFLWVTDGMPVFYYGDEQFATGADDPSNREALWKLGASAYDTTSTTYLLITKLSLIRRAASSFSSSFYTSKTFVISTTSNDIVLSKYPLLSVLTNRGSAQSGGSMITVPTSYPAGTVVVNALNCAKSTVNSAGQLSVLVQRGEAQVFLPQAAIQSGSGFCSEQVVVTSCCDKYALRVQLADQPFPG